MFDDAEHRYTIALISVRKTGTPDDVVAVRGPFTSYSEYLREKDEPPVELPALGLKEWSEGAALPLIQTREMADVFLKMRKNDSLEQLSFRGIAELHATNDRNRGFFSVDMEEMPTGSIPVFKGASFNIWENDTGVRAGWSHPDEIVNELHRRRMAGQTRSRSAFFNVTDEWLADQSTLPMRNPRIVFRGITNRTNSRTVIASLLPPNTTVQNSAPYLFSKSATQTDEAYLLGVLCSAPLDWYARRVVEVNLNFFILDKFPIPKPNLQDERTLKVIELSARLAAVDDRYSDWAKRVGVPVGSVKSQAEKEDLIAELDAVVAHLYGLDTDDLKVIWNTFHTTVDHLPNLDAVLDHFERWA